MQAITIPKALIKNDDLVVIPRKEYEKLFCIAESIDKDQLWFWTKEWQKKEKEADADIKLNRLSGPYKSKKELQSALDALK